MPNRLTTVAVLVFLGLLMPGTVVGAATQSVPASASSSDSGKRVDVTASLGHDRLDHLVQDRENGAAEPEEAASPRVRRTGQRTAVFYAHFPRLQTLADGSRCLGIGRKAFPDPSSAAIYEDAENVLWHLTLDDYQPCPGAQVPVRTPATEAAAFWRVSGEDLLPKPAPRIAPGYMLAGKLAYLETGATMTTRFAHATPLGPLTIDATSTVYVDWGDGSGRDGPHAGPGGPWPNGTITHTWTTAQPYDITVVQQWTATWRLGEASGTLDGLTTEAGIEDFPVRQLQAVRNV